MQAMQGTLNGTGVTAHGTALTVSTALGIPVKNSSKNKIKPNNKRNDLTQRTEVESP